MHEMAKKILSMMHNARFAMFFVYKYTFLFSFD